MPYAKWAKAERKYGKPMPQILIEMFEKHDYKKAVAAELNVTPEALDRWIDAAKCRVVQRIVCDEEARAAK